MNTLLWVIAAFGLFFALLACGKILKLSHEVNRLKRNEYYTESKLKGVARQIADAVEPLRHHVALMSSGASVEEELIRTGQWYRDITAQEARALLGETNNIPDGEILVVDVRTPKEYAIKHIPGAKLIPIEELESRYAGEIPQGAKKILVYCAGGDRSRLACDFLSRKGYGNVFNIFDGLQRWMGPTTGEGTMNLIQIGSKSRTGS